MPDVIPKEQLEKFCKGKAGTLLMTMSAATSIESLSFLQGQLMIIRHLANEFDLKFHIDLNFAHIYEHIKKEKQTEETEPERIAS